LQSGHEASSGGRYYHVESARRILDETKLKLDSKYVHVWVSTSIYADTKELLVIKVVSREYSSIILFLREVFEKSINEPLLLVDRVP
jgi:hypothetical protein